MISSASSSSFVPSGAVQLAECLKPLRLEDEKRLHFAQKRNHLCGGLLGRPAGPRHVGDGLVFPDLLHAGVRHRIGGWTRAMQPASSAVYGSAFDLLPNPN